MIVLDVNVLLALFREDHPDHEVAHTWWESESQRGTSITVPDLVWVGFLRIATDRRAFTDPAPLEHALRFVRSVADQPAYARFVAHPHLLDAFVRTCDAGRVVGNRVTDAYIAAVTISLGARLATFDRDFRRFDGLVAVELA